MGPHFAHSLPHLDKQHWESLERHLSEVADTAANFAAAFDAADWGRLAGLWHDLGKFSAEFQHYIGGDSDAHAGEMLGRVDHSTAGAVHANRSFPAQAGRLLAYIIAGHHTGLPDAVAADGGQSGLDARLRKQIPSIATAPASVLAQNMPRIPSFQWNRHSSAEMGFQLALFGRMIFSCLVDADYLRTEAFYGRNHARARVQEAPSVAAMAVALDAHLHNKTRSTRDDPVTRQRQFVLQRCRESADLPPGLFSLTVPTGGGKTFSSLAFALRHAQRHGLRRVIYAIPFTSIIEQNAQAFRVALASVGGHAVLEHHSNLDPRRQSLQSQLAAENWDAPLVVTTNVQLLESLFAARPSRCRKLHRIAGSVIILDEAQTIPVDLLRPTLAALAELCRNYGCSVVLCTATQPALNHRADFPIGLHDVREIIGSGEAVSALFATMRRVKVVVEGHIDDPSLAHRLAAEPQVLCIVNTRRHAAELFAALATAVPQGTFHLSTWMCPRHRSAVLRLVRSRLRRGLPCRVVSTQLIEAGVDVDFPCVYRAMAGLDSVAQAAGRCNREGLRASGTVYLFEPTTPPPPGFLRLGASATGELLPDHHSDPLSLPAIEQYFRLVYWKRRDERQWDMPSVMSCFRIASDLHLQYRQAAELYRLIDNDDVPVIVPYGRRGRRLLTQLRSRTESPDRYFDRAAQRFIVGLRQNVFDALLAAGRIVVLHDRFSVLVDASAYDRRLGLTPPRQ